MATTFFTRQGSFAENGIKMKMKPRCSQQICQQPIHIIFVEQLDLSANLDIDKKANDLFNKFLTCCICMFSRTFS